jgi:hypothetical protein
MQSQAASRTSKPLKSLYSRQLNKVMDILLRLDVVVGFLSMSSYARYVSKNSLIASGTEHVRRLSLDGLDHQPFGSCRAQLSRIRTIRT